MLINSYLFKLSMVSWRKANLLCCVSLSRGASGVERLKKELRLIKGKFRRCGDALDGVVVLGKAMNKNSHGGDNNMGKGFGSSHLI